MEMVNIITLWLHYLATVMWIGGMAFNLLVLRPSMTVIDQNQRPVLGTMVLKRFIIFAWLPASFSAAAHLANILSKRLCNQFHRLSHCRKNMDRIYDIIDSHAILYSKHSFMNHICRK